MSKAPPSTADDAAEARTWARWFARGSIIAPFGTLLLMAVARQLERNRAPEVSARIDFIASVCSLLLLLAGLGLGIAAVVGGLRRRSRDTVTIAGLGLFVGGLVLLLTVWAVVFTTLAGAG